MLPEKCPSSFVITKKKFMNFTAYHHKLARPPDPWQVVGRSRDAKEAGITSLKRVKNKKSSDNTCSDINETCSDVPETFGGIRKHSNFGKALFSTQFLFCFFQKKSKFRASQRTSWDASPGRSLREKNWNISEFLWLPLIWKVSGTFNVGAWILEHRGTSSGLGWFHDHPMLLCHMGRIFAQDAFIPGPNFLAQSLFSQQTLDNTEPQKWHRS